MAGPTPLPIKKPDPDPPGTDPSCAMPQSSEPLTILNRPSTLREKPAPAPSPPSAVTVRETVAERKPPAQSPGTIVETPVRAKDETRPALVRPILRVVRGEIPGQEFPVLDGKNYIGRATPDKPMDIDMTAQERVEQVWVSRQHAVVTLDRSGAVIVEDLNSLNGTFVNRARIHPGQPRQLQPGDVLQVGTVQMRLDV